MLFIFHCPFSTLLHLSTKAFKQFILVPNIVKRQHKLFVREAFLHLPCSSLFHLFVKITSFHMIIILILSSPFVPKYLKFPNMAPSRCEEAFLIQIYSALLYLKNWWLSRFPSSLNYVLCYEIGTENLVQVVKVEVSLM